ncbi:MAG: substrate-binding domain-containing protein [Christensenellaceae bacterium]|jgi:phosphate transport system substrate-binding protein|nr:substrate-binding domain-containing protein [Christensenellaceae bacterium]
MKKTLSIISICLCLCLCIAIAFVGCTNTQSEKEILVISREAGSGTRDAFDGLIKNSAGDSLAKKSDGSAYESSIFVSSLNMQSGTSAVITKVASTVNAIGYISLGSVDDTIKAISVDGVSPSASTVLDGTYALKRPFVIMTKKGLDLTAASADFMKYLKSKQAQTIVDANKYVKQENSDQVDYVAPASAITGSVILKGSTSVEPLMQKLIADYQTKGGTNVTGVAFDLDAQGSSAGISATKADIEGTVIGMSSSALKAADAESLDAFNIALDAVAIIVNKENTITNLTVAQIFDIYTGKITKFSEIG